MSSSAASDVNSCGGADIPSPASLLSASMHSRLSPPPAQISLAAAATEASCQHGQ